MQTLLSHTLHDIITNVGYGHHTKEQYDCVVEREEYGHSYIDAAHMIRVIF